MTATPPPNGGAFGRYRLIERIGTGGMAEIWRAVAVGEQGFERTVAIKRIREEVAQVADIGKLFADEARLSALLDHPNVVQVYDFGAVEGTYYIAMEYLKGRNLDQVLFALRRTRERIEPALAVFIAREVARGLAYAHSLCDDRGRPLDIVHRDVSPANIMLLSAGAVKLLDFGIARITSELRLAVTQGRALRGKCPYLAPEQITGGAVDGRSDVFALGVVLWEMLTGDRLFTGEDDADTITSVLNREIPLPSSLAPEVPPALDRIVLAALARNTEQRYRSADTMAADLDEVMRALPSRHGDLPALLGRVFGRPTGELPAVAADPLQTAPRFALELPTVAAGRGTVVPVSPHDVTRPRLPLDPLPAGPAAAAVVSPPAPAEPAAAAPVQPSGEGSEGRPERSAGHTQVITAADGGRRATARVRALARPGAGGLFLVLILLLAASELVAQVLFHEIQRYRDRRRPAVVVAVDRVPPPLADGGQNGPSAAGRACTPCTEGAVAQPAPTCPPPVSSPLCPPPAGLPDPAPVSPIAGEAPPARPAAKRALSRSRRHAKGGGARPAAKGSTPRPTRRPARAVDLRPKVSLPPAGARPPGPGEAGRPSRLVGLDVSVGASRAGAN